MGFAGSNGLAAFAAQATTFLLALATFESRLWIRLVYYALAAYSAVCVMYSFSRGGYAALLIGCLVIGVLKQRKILVALIVLVVAWTSIVPPAVRQRVEMTYDSQSGELDNSARTRLSLWDSAMEVFDSNVALGTGFYTYPYMHLNERTDGVSGFYEDTHNFFVRVLVETGLVGMIIFLWLLAMALREGYRLFRQACDKFYASLGLGLVCWLACSAVANCFGDRWTLLQVNGYMWVLAGLVSRAWQLEHSSSASPVRHPIFGTFENPKAAAL